jgi:hypothetical protein
MQSGEVGWAADSADAPAPPEVGHGRSPAQSPALHARDHVCWGDPRTGELLEGIVRRTFDTFAEVELPDPAGTRTMVYRRRLARVSNT